MCGLGFVSLAENIAALTSFPKGKIVDDMELVLTFYCSVRSVEYRPGYDRSSSLPFPGL